MTEESDTTCDSCLQKDLVKYQYWKILFISIWFGIWALALLPIIFKGAEYWLNAELSVKFQFWMGFCCSWLY